MCDCQLTHVPAFCASSSEVFYAVTRLIADCYARHSGYSGAGQVPQLAPSKAYLNASCLIGLTLKAICNATGLRRPLHPVSICQIAVHVGLEPTTPDRQSDVLATTLMDRLSAVPAAFVVGPAGYQESLLDENSATIALFCTRFHHVKNGFRRNRQGLSTSLTALYVGFLGYNICPCLQSFALAASLATY